MQPFCLISIFCQCFKVILLFVLVLHCQVWGTSDELSRKMCICDYDHLFLFCFICCSESLWCLTSLWHCFCLDTPLILPSHFLLCPQKYGSLPSAMSAVQESEHDTIPLVSKVCSSWRYLDDSWDRSLSVVGDRRFLWYILRRQTAIMFVFLFGSIISISNLMQWLLGAGRIDQSKVDQVNAFIVANQCPILTPNLSIPDVKKIKVRYIFTDWFHAYLDVGLLLCWLIFGHFTASADSFIALILFASKPAEYYRTELTMNLSELILLYKFLVH